MTKHQYSPIDFFRQVPNNYLHRYFRERNLLPNLDINHLEETDVNPIFEAWSALPPTKRSETERDFALIDLVADEKGTQAIIEEAHFHEEDLSSVLGDMPGFFHRAFWTFFERPSYLRVASKFRETDELPKRYWRERKEIPETKPRDDQAGKEDLAKAIRAYFSRKEGRGYACEVDILKRSSRYYYFAYTEDHSDTIIEFGEDNKLRQRMHRPAFEVVFVYYPERGTLSTYCNTGVRVIRDLQEIFGREILVMNLPNLGHDQRVFNLNLLKDRNFQFRCNPSAGIADVRVRQLKLAFIGGGSRRITLEAGASDGQKAVYGMMDDILDTKGIDDGKRMPLSFVNVVKAGIQVTFVPGGDDTKSPRNFTVTYPNSCNLGQDGIDLLLREMLVDSGIGPHIKQQGLFQNEH